MFESEGGLDLGDFSNDAFRGDDFARLELRPDKLNSLAHGLGVALGGGRELFGR